MRERIRIEYRSFLGREGVLRAPTLDPSLPSELHGVESLQKWLALENDGLMEWVAIISLIIVGIALIVVEIIFVPGTTVVGILGFGMIIGGIVMAFNNFGIRTGYTVAGATAVATGLALFWSLRTKPWRKLSLQSAIDSRVNEGALADLKVGDEGVAVSALRPAGKAEIGGEMYEVTTLGNFAPAGTPVKVIRISSNQVVVEPKPN